MGFGRADDAGVYKLTDDLAIIQTIDFFTPIVNEPYVFGQIAVANALSDVYAMGGTPITAMNVVCFPRKTMDINVLREILAGGVDKMKEAGVILVGGHSVIDPELKYGLSVTGIIHPERVLTNTGIKVGDRLILTKPLGIGIVSTAIKGEVAEEEHIKTVQSIMTELNKVASCLMQEVGVNACTDVTGFGFLGHASEMVQSEDNIGIIVYASRIPLIEGTLKFVAEGIIPAGTYENRKFYESRIEFLPGVHEDFKDILFDPQTSGGLLISVSEEKSAELVELLLLRGIKCAIVGEVIEGLKGKILVKWE